MENFFNECLERGCPQSDLQALPLLALRRAVEARGLFPVLGHLAGLALPSDGERTQDTRRNVECAIAKLHRAISDRGCGVSPLLARICDAIHTLAATETREAMRDALQEHLARLARAESERRELNELAYTLVLAYARSLTEESDEAWQAQLDAWQLG